MAFPPNVPPATRTNTTPHFDNHPSDHNTISSALTDIINETTKKVSKTGDTMTGLLDMSGNAIGGLANATGAGNAVSRGFGDGRYAMIAASTAAFTGSYIQIGDDPAGGGGSGVSLSQTGIVRSGVGNTAVGSPNVLCNRWGTGGAMVIGEPFVRFDRNGTTIGNIAINSGTSVSFNTTSDYRLKDVEGPIVDPVDRLSQLNPITFHWKEDATQGEGFLAHEVAEVLPSAVMGDKDAVAGPPPTRSYEDEEGNTVEGPDPSAPEEGTIIPQQLDVAKLVPLLTAALQEALVRIDDLEARVTALEG